MKKELAMKIFVAAFFIIFTLFLFRPYIFGNLVPLPFNLLVSYYSPWRFEESRGYGIGIANKPLGYDNLKLFIPFRKFTTEQVNLGKIPLWNPYVFSGNVHLATFQSAVLYPLNILYTFLPLSDAWSILIIVQPILAGLFTFLFLRSLSISGRGSFLGAVGFAYSGWMMALWQEVLVINQSILWLPLSLYGVNVIASTPTRWWRGSFLLGVSLVFSILGGFPQMIIYHAGTVIVWSLYRWVGAETLDKSKVFLAVSSSFLLSLGVTAIGWVPALEAYLLSPRGAVDSAYIFQMFLTPLWHLFTFVAPDFWGNPGTYNYFEPIVYLQERTLALGVGVFFLSLLSFALNSRGSMRFWKIFTLVTLSLGFALPTSWIWYILHVPVLSAAQPARIFILPVFGICVLAAYAYDVVIVRKSKIPRWPVTVTVGVFVVAALFIALDTVLLKNFSYATISLRNLGLSVAFFAAASFLIYKMRGRSTFFFIGMTLLTCLWVVYYANKLLYFSERRFEYPIVAPIQKLQEIARFDRVWGYGDGYVTRNIASYFHLYSPEGYEALYSYRYGMFLNTIQTHGALLGNIARTDATLSETGQYEKMTYNPYRLRMLSLLSVKYILERKGDDSEGITAKERFPDSLFRLAWQDEQWRIWEYKDALPRSFFAPTYLLRADGQATIDSIYDSGVNLGNTVIIDRVPTLPIEACCTDETARMSDVQITRYDNEFVSLSVTAPRDGFVFLSDQYFPGWKATVDGMPATIYRADYTFRAVEIPKGNHEVQFVYDPLSWHIAKSVMLGSFVSVVGAYGVVVFRSKGKRRQHEK